MSGLTPSSVFMMFWGPYPVMRIEHGSAAFKAATLNFAFYLHSHTEVFKPPPKQNPRELLLSGKLLEKIFHSLRLSLFGLSQNCSQGNILCHGITGSHGQSLNTIVILRQIRKWPPLKLKENLYNEIGGFERFSPVLAF